METQQKTNKEEKEMRETSVKIKLSDKAKKEIEFCLYDWQADMSTLGKKIHKIIDYSIYINYETDEEELDNGGI